MEKKLYRSRKNSIVGGLCGGVGNYLGMDPTIVRVLWILSGIGIFMYIILLFIVPHNPNEGNDV